MQATSGITQSFNRTGHVHFEYVPSSLITIGIFVFMLGVCISLSNIINVLSFSHVAIGARAAVSTCAALLFALLLTRLTLICLARLNGLRSLVGLTMRLATNSA